jgi:hypothetical protein
VRPGGKRRPPAVSCCRYHSTSSTSTQLTAFFVGYRLTRRHPKPKRGQLPPGVIHQPLHDLFVMVRDHEINLPVGGFVTGAQKKSPFTVKTAAGGRSGLSGTGCNDRARRENAKQGGANLAKELTTAGPRAGSRWRASGSRPEFEAAELGKLLVI